MRAGEISDRVFRVFRRVSSICHSIRPISGTYPSSGVIIREGLDSLTALSFESEAQNAV
jgi:hypothetical protein